MSDVRENRRLCNALFEFIREVLLVEENVRISELLIEPVLHLLHADHDAIQIRIPC